MTTPAVGEVVMLKSGGPRMTVVSSDGDRRTAGFFSYNVYSTMTADAAAFAYSGSEDPEADTLTTDAIPRHVTGTLDETTEEFQVNAYTITESEGGDRTFTLQVVVPNNSTLDLTLANFLVHVEFISDIDNEHPQDVAASYVSVGPLRYLAGGLVRLASVAFPEPVYTP